MQEAAHNSPSSSEEDNDVPAKQPAAVRKTPSPLVGTQDLLQSQYTQQPFPYQLSQPSQLSQGPPIFASAVTRAPINVGLMPMPGMQWAVHQSPAPLEPYQMDPWPPYMCAGSDGHPYYYDNGKGRPPLPSKDKNRRTTSAPVSRAPSPLTTAAKKKKKNNVNKHGRTKEEEENFQS
ncbi:hypothetical protein SEMRO_2623_G332890.1 [Seminavis robusta]|uniref:Uncharacterized protein n=1 Tax=Seminavis robusta TaxID=568900 RepID=A0A9N8HYS3_9STRA|nr:hypothetical protein SEMRO_2623_G332890.1 [Seminavis robusta]|eukprot:Sro2623_g332890.1 n/a (177) ;mRNA; f:3619-4149